MAKLTVMLNEIVTHEPEVMAWTNRVAEPFVMFAQDAFEIFATAVTESVSDCLLFRGAYSHARKMAGLAVLSALRQHKIENGLNLRQVVEATSLFGYLAANPGLPGSFGKADQTHAELVASNERLRKDAFDWSKKNIPRPRQRPSVLQGPHQPQPKPCHDLRHGRCLRLWSHRRHRRRTIL